MATANLIDLRQPRDEMGDLPSLQMVLAQLIGEPFRFARVSYGDELTLHFGDLRPARSPKLKGVMYGAYILGVRASPWVLKAGAEPFVLAAGVHLDSVPAGLCGPIRKEEIEANPLVRPDSRVLSAIAFEVQPVNGYGLQLRTSDGSALHVLPEMPGELEENEDLPELADWELTSPDGLLSVGPGPRWSFKPSSR